MAQSPVGSDRHDPSNLYAYGDMWRITLSIAFFALLSCGPVHTPLAIVGKYDLRSREAYVVLTVWGDSTYLEEVTYPGGDQETSSDRWSDAGTCFRFDSFLMPRVDGVSPEDSFSGPGTAAALRPRKTPRGTDKLDWCLAGESVFGRARLVVYPDAGIFFRRVAPG